ncbi:MAG TPA: type IV pilus assembly protein PilM [Candidatus Woesebacteria bacterium]|nr:type IV pilus assembly protein PilM [Candidatus Woesebacteria bacterium]
MSITAIDIGTYSIKAVVTKDSKNQVIQKAIETPNKLGIVAPKSDQEVLQFGEMIANLFHDYKLEQTDVRLSLPEYLVTTKVIEVPFLNDAELASAIGWQAEQAIPIPKNDLLLQYQVLEKPTKKTADAKMKVLLVGASKSSVEKINNIFLNIGIEATLLETQMFSVIRSLDIQSNDPETIILQMGASSNDIAVIANGMFEFVFNSKTGSALVDSAIAQSFNLDNKQAEEYKINYGLDPTQMEGKLLQIISPVIDNLIIDLQKAIRFFTQNHPENKIKRVVLSGGPAAMKGLTERIVQALNIEVLQAAPFAKAKGQIPEQNQLSFSVCMGLIARKL